VGVTVTRPVKSHVFRGRRYAIKWFAPRGQHIAWCDDPKRKGKTILLPTNQPERDTLRATIDEAIHACQWDIDNDAVGEISTDIAAFLWRLGWRKG
jgi:hypothetical protein